MLAWEWVVLLVPLLHESDGTVMLASVASGSIAAEELIRLEVSMIRVDGSHFKIRNRPLRTGFEKLKSENVR